MRRRPEQLAAGLAVAGLAVLAGSAPAAAATSCPGADATPAAIGAERAAAALHCLVNHERQAAGVGPVAAEPHAMQAAVGQANDMALRGFFDHTNPDGVGFVQRLTGTGLDWLAAGENLARGQRTPREAMAAWLASPGHCHNVLGATYTGIGYGVVTGLLGPWWVQELVRPAGVAAPTVADVPCPRQPAVPAPAGALDGPPDDSAFTLPTPAAAPAAGSPSAAPAPGPAAPSRTTAPAAAPGVQATAVRAGRRLRLRVVLRSSAGRPARTVVRVAQGGRAVRTLTARWTAGRPHAVRLTLARAAAGRVDVRSDAGRAAVRFR